MSSEEANPLVQVYGALVDLLRSRERLRGMVRVGNVLRLTGDDRSPFKEETLSADYPELRVITTDATPHLQRTSNSTTIVKRYEVQISTGDQRVELLLAIEWEIHRALSSWSTKLSGLTWMDKKFVKLARPTQVQDGVSNVDLNRGVTGWSSIWTYEVEMWFTTTDMQAT